MSSDVLAGTGLHDLRNATTSVIEGDWVAAGLHGALTGVEGTGLATDPFGTLATWGVGWVIEHLQPLAGWYDDLAGDPDLIRGRAKDMYASAAAVTSLADDTVAATRHGFGSLTGRAADAAQARGHEMASTLVELGQAAQAMGEGLEKAAALVEGVRNLMRDLIAEVVVWIGKKLGPGAATLVMDLPDLLRRKIPRARQVFEWLTSSMSALSKLVDMVKSALTNLVAVGQEMVTHTLLSALSAAEWRLPRSIVLIAAEAGLGVVARANDDAGNRPPEPRASRVPHSARQAP